MSTAPMNHTPLPGAENARAASILNIIAGIWLIISPFALGLAMWPAAVCNNVVVGAVVLILAAVRASNPLHARGLSWINFLLGIWLIISPFVLVNGARPVALATNNVILGIVVLVLAVWSAFATPLAGRMAR